MGAWCSCLPTKQEPYSQLSSSINDVCLSVRAGDIILFSGTSLNSVLIEAFTASQWSHIGIVIEDPNVDMRGHPLLLESVRSEDGVIDALTHPPRSSKGVRIVRLRSYLQNYKGNVIAVRYLQTEERQKEFAQMMNRILLDVQTTLYGRPYEKRWLEFFLARFCTMVCAFNQTPDSFFCSELVAHCYQKAGLLQASRATANSFLPDDFCSTGSLHIHSPSECVFGRVVLSPERYIVLTASSCQ